MDGEGEKEIVAASLRETIFFYLTAFFFLLATFSLFAFLFLVPFFIEPALKTIYMEFDPEPVNCETIEATFRVGLSNCNWTSCQEGCTKDLFECWHVHVRYRVPSGRSGGALTTAAAAAAAAAAVNGARVAGPLKSAFKLPVVDSNDSDGNRLQSVLPDPASEEQDGEHGEWHEARLQPNVKGCGYPPDVECNNTFVPTYGLVGLNFSCYYSMVEPKLAITHLDMDAIYSDLVYCLTIPIILFFLSIAYLLYAYFKIYADSPEGADPAASACHTDVDGQPEQLEPLSHCSSSASLTGKFDFMSADRAGYEARARQLHRIVRRTKSGGAIAPPPTSAAPPESKTYQQKGMRLSKSMGDSRKVPVTTTINDLITGDLEGRAKVLATSVGNRNSHVNSPSPSEDEPTLAV